MSKLKENELAENLLEFAEKTTIEITFENGLEGSIVLKNATIVYDEKNGYIDIISKDSDIKINTVLVYKYEKIENYLCINLDTVTLKIRKLTKFVD